jgi:hypothetical protein
MTHPLPAASEANQCTKRPAHLPIHQLFRKNRPTLAPLPHQPVNSTLSSDPAPRALPTLSRRSSAVEQLIRNQQVIGSIPIVGSNRINALALRLGAAGSIVAHLWRISQDLSPSPTPRIPLCGRDRQPSSHESSHGLRVTFVATLRDPRVLAARAGRRGAAYEPTFIGFLDGEEPILRSLWPAAEPDHSSRCQAPALILDQSDQALLF